MHLHKNATLLEVKGGGEWTWQFPTNILTVIKTLKLYKRRYKVPHPNAGTWNLVWRAKIKLERGIPAQDFSTNHRDAGQALRMAEKRLDELRAQLNVGMDISIKRFVEASRLLLVKLKIENRRGEVSDE